MYASLLPLDVRSNVAAVGSKSTDDAKIPQIILLPISSTSIPYPCSKPELPKLFAKLKFCDEELIGM